MHYPEMIQVKQKFPADSLPDVRRSVREELKRLQLHETIAPGARVAVTAGSRGISDIALILKTIIEALKHVGAAPFIVPAMGSHGGGTPDGQKMVLETYGITESAMGVPIEATMAVAPLGETADGLPVFLDRAAFEADRIVVVNRIKPHTEFKGPVESGLLKMMAIGLGNQKGAALYHRAVVQHGYYPVIRSVAREIMRRGPIAFAVAVVENERDETALIRAIRPEAIEKTEEDLLLTAKERMPKIPFNPIDLLIVDQIGKDISGSGMDPNVIGRQVVRFADFSTDTRITRIFVRDLSSKSYGNADGIGLADFTTRRLVDRMDRQATYTGCLTAGAPECGRIPVYFDTDRQAVDAALNSIGLVTPEQAKVVHIKNTGALERIVISGALLPEAEQRQDLSVIGGPRPLRFDADGSLVSPWNDERSS